MQTYLYIILKEKNMINRRTISDGRFWSGQESQQSRNLSYLIMEEASGETARSS